MTLEPYSNLLPGSAARDGAIVTAASVVMKVSSDILQRCVCVCAGSRHPFESQHAGRVRSVENAFSSSLFPSAQGEVVSEGAVWSGQPAKPLGHRAAADYRRAIDDNWWCRRPKPPLSEAAAGPGDDDDDDDIVMTLDTAHDVLDGIRLLDLRQPTSTSFTGRPPTPPSADSSRSVTPTGDWSRISPSQLDERASPMLLGERMSPTRASPTRSGRRSSDSRNGGSRSLRSFDFIGEEEAPLPPGFV